MTPLAQTLLRQTPTLRRYARALTGGAEAGDALVGRLLSECVADPGGHGCSVDGSVDRLALYAALNGLFDDHGGQAELGGARHPMEQALNLLPERQRRLFLLVSLEELSLADAAEVLGIPPDMAKGQLAEAQESLREALVATIMIVEDDAIIAFDLAETVRGMGHRVCGTATTMEAALSTARTCQPTIALMDVRLAHGDSGIVTAQALRRSSELPIIFVTAFGDELTRRGLEHLGPVIPKPFTRDQIERAITKAVFAPGEATRLAGADRIPVR